MAPVSVGVRRTVADVQQAAHLDEQGEPNDGSVGKWNMLFVALALAASASLEEIGRVEAAMLGSEKTLQRDHRWFVYPGEGKSLSRLEAISSDLDIV